MEPCSLHPYSEELAKAYVDQLPDELDLSDRGLRDLSSGFARFLAEHGPTFAADGLSLTAWEARIDRGLAMLLRPPSRLFGDVGLPAEVARKLPIRLDLHEGQMGGGYLPARLAGDAAALLDRNLERSVRRMAEAEMDAARLQGLMTEAVQYADAHNLGLFEAIGVVVDTEPASWPRSGRVVVMPSDRDVQQRVALALKPEPKPGRLSKLLGRFSG
ncbi:MAG: hypothetical protein KF883_07320 [Thermomicrobiales bacterium]|nr:hypothetical protein [Thermomicrobiales bacterium]